MKKATAIIFSLCAMAFAATAEDSNLLKNGDFSRGKTNWVTAGTVAEEGNAGVLTLNAKANRANSRQTFEVDPEATYKISAKISADNKFSQILIGIIPVSKNNYDMFYRNSAGAVKNTFTELAEDVVKGTNKIVLKDNPAWKAGWLAFNAKEDMSDLPNFQLLAFKDFERKDGKIIITLPKPYNRAYAAGTKVRLHMDGATYPYTSTIRKATKEPQEFSGTIGKNAKVKFPAGTASFKVIVLLIPGKGAPNVTMQVRDMKIEKLPAAK